MPDAAITPASLPDTDGPLAGRRILVTRPGKPGERFAAMLDAQGADVLHAPLTRIETVDRPGLAWRLEQGMFEWVLFTSANGVRAAADAARLVTPSGLREVIARAQVAAVGRATAEALHDEGIAPVVVPGRFDAEALLDALADRDDVRGRRVLHPAAAGANELLAGGLAALGADVETVIAYASVPDRTGAIALATMVRGQPVDLATFLAPSAVEAYVATLGPLRRIPAASIGPVTSAALAVHGIPVLIQPAEATASCLVDAIVDHYIR